jgi:hypothetical protein
MTAAVSGFLGGSYPERDDKPPSKLERAITAARYYAGLRGAVREPAKSPDAHRRRR